MKNLFFILFLMLTGCGGNSISAFWQNREAVQLLQKQEYSDAVAQLSQGLAQSPFDPVIHFNLGYALEEPMGSGENQTKKNKISQDAVGYAIKSYVEAEKNGTSEIQFYSRFNQARLLGESGKIEQALDLYQAALQIKPESIEVKTNIELLLSQKNQDDKKKDQKKENSDQQQGDGQGEQDKKDGKDNKKDQKKNDDQNKDDKNKKDQNKDGKDKDKSKEDKKDGNKDDGKNQQQNDKQPKSYKNNSQYKPRPYQGDQLNENDVKQILSELKQQDQKIRSQYGKEGGKEAPRDKDW